jgi:hypothetical protein
VSIVTFGAVLPTVIRISSRRQLPDALAHKPLGDAAVPAA